MVFVSASVRGFFTTKQTNQNHDQGHKYHHLMKTLHFNDSEDDYRSGSRNATNNSLSEDYTRQTKERISMSYDSEARLALLSTTKQPVNVHGHFTGLEISRVPNGN